MSVSIIRRPKGYVITGSAFIVDVINDAGNALFGTFVAHGLTNGDTVYMTTEADDYNGFFQIEVDTATEFRLFQDQTSTYVTFIKQLTQANDNFAEFKKTNLTHGVSAVHLPITYKLSNTLYPTNSVDTVRTITTLSNYSGFARLGLSGSLGTFEDLSFVKISGASDDDLNGVWQVIDKISTTDVMLNIDYTTVNGAGILGASIQLYYGNYNIVVEVYAGINSSHTWTALKPYELAATLELIPDENNEVFFSINDILKAYVESKNNLTIASLPNNIDAWTNFYIKTAEQYDTSNGYTVSTNLSSFTSDLSTFEGTAINAKLEFKNIHSGSMSEYLMENILGKFLTLFETPVLFSGGYSDISWISLYSAVVTFKKQWYASGVLILTENVSTDGTSGVIRTELEANCNADRLDISIVQIPLIAGLASWAEQVSGTRQWVIDVAPDCALLSSTSSYYLYVALPTIPGNTYSISYSLTNSTGVDTDVTFDIFLLSSAFAVVGTVVSDNFSSATMSGVGTNITATAFGTYLAIKVAQTDVGATTVTVNSVSVSATEIPLSEVKTLDVNCGCSDQDLRLSWLNNLGGMEPEWNFTAQKGHAIDITEANETLKNILPNWPKSYGAFADTIRKQTNRKSIIKQFVTSQLLTEDQVDAIAFIKSSILVQIVNSRTDRRTVIVDTDSFLKRTDGDKTFTISFNILYTDDIPSQTV